MTTSSIVEKPFDEVLYRGWRDLRDLGHATPGISFERNAMRELGLLQDDDVAEGHQARVTIFENGKVLIDLQVNQGEKVDDTKLDY